MIRDLTTKHRMSFSLTMGSNCTSVGRGMKIVTLQLALVHVCTCHDGITTTMNPDPEPNPDL